MSDTSELMHAVVLAGGQGTRSGLRYPKQMHEIEGVSCLERVYAAFAAHPEVAQITVVSAQAQMAQTGERIAVAKRRLPAPVQAKAHRVIAGGARRVDSAYQGVRAVAQAMREEDHARAWVLIHDAARPFVSQELISRLYAQTQIDSPPPSAICPVLPITDTVWECQHERTRIDRILNRDALVTVQTPQLCQLAALLKAFSWFYAQDTKNEKDAEDAAVAVTCDISLLWSADSSARIKLIEGERTNRKLTYPEDFR